MKNTTPSSDVLEVIRAIRENKLQENVGLIEDAASMGAQNIDQLFELAIACANSARFNDALLIFNKIHKYKNNDVLLFYNLGLIFSIQGHHDQALEMYLRALHINPNHADSLTNIGSTLADIGRNEEALLKLDHALTLNPNIAVAWANKALIFSRMGLHKDALEAYQKAYDIDKSIDYLLGDLIFTKMKICDWDNLFTEKNNLIKQVELGHAAIKPFSALGLFDSEQLQEKIAKIYSKKICPPILERPAFSNFTIGQKMRIGYFSADFHNHATSHLMAQFFELHDKNKFDLIAFSFGPDTNDESRKRISNAFDQFIDVRKKTDYEISSLSRELNIHIAIDLKGYTKDSRPGIFSHGAAPIQVSYLGYPGTMGVKTMDYIIADKTLIPETSQAYFSEKIIYLPNSYQVNDAQRVISSKAFTRKDLGLPEEAFVFCCFNNNYKILPETYKSWMNILKSVEGSVLWLLEDNPWAAENLKHYATKTGVDPKRIIFAKRIPLSEHLARHSQADLFLDTLPCNAHTTASDALWAGLPILTIIGNTFAGRVCSSLLKAVGLSDLIVETQLEYERLAIELAKDSKKLLSIKERLVKGRHTHPLFDTKRLTLHIEEAYQIIMRRSIDSLSAKNTVIR